MIVVSWQISHYFFTLDSLLSSSKLPNLFLTDNYIVPGKTLLAKTLARFVNVPFVIADATTLTQAS